MIYIINSTVRCMLPVVHTFEQPIYQIEPLQCVEVPPCFYGSALQDMHMYATIAKTSSTTFNATLCMREVQFVISVTQR